MKLPSKDDFEFFDSDQDGNLLMEEWEAKMKMEVTVKNW